MFIVFNKITKLTMQSIKIKVEEYSKKNPHNRNFLEDYVKKREEVIYAKQDDYENGKMFESAKELCEYDVANFKKPVLPGFKYKLELLKTNDADYELLESSINFGDELTDKSFKHQLDLRLKAKGLKIYRVVPNNNISIEPSDSNQILLLHGTKAQNVEGILKTGFNPSKNGSYGPGVYLTNSFDYAYNYSKSYATEEKVIKKFRHFFVNNVPNPGKCVLDSQYLTNRISFNDYLHKQPTVKMYKYNLVGKQFKIKESQLDLYDSYNRKLLEGSFQKIDQQKIALAHHS